jgi:(S)-2-hydroxy-acid oxidase
MCKEDALLAVKNGADAIWVSNGSGRILDTVPSTISVLKSISKAVKKDYPKIEIYLDGGIRRGTDVMKALAYGANAVFIGNPILWALAKGGKDAVKEMMELLNEELKVAMILTHCMSVSEIKENYVIHMVKGKL